MTIDELRRRLTTPRAGHEVATVDDVLAVLDWLEPLARAAVAYDSTLRIINGMVEDDAMAMPPDCAYLRAISEAYRPVLRAIVMLPDRMRFDLSRTQEADR